MDRKESRTRQETKKRRRLRPSSNKVFEVGEEEMEKRGERVRFITEAHNSAGLQKEVQEMVAQGTPQMTLL